MKQVAEWNLLPHEQRHLIIEQKVPVVLRGQVKHWELVKKSSISFSALAEYLLQFDAGKPLEAMLLHPNAKGRFFYTDNFQGLNFERINGLLSEALKILASFAQLPSPPGFYVGAKEMETYFPGMMDHCVLAGIGDGVVPNLWLGNQTLIAVHNDHSENMACVAAGRRKFVLFPPDQVDNLYVVDSALTPSGRPVSAVNLRAPDLIRFPKFREALNHALRVELLPGDVLYIPTDWWHGVEALSPINVLVNFWWKGSPPQLV